MKGLPVTFRYLDPTLHGVHPQQAGERQKLATDLPASPRRSSTSAQIPSMSPTP